MQYSFHSEQWVPYPIESVFAFFANPHNLPLLVPKWQRAQVEETAITPPPPRPASAVPVPRAPGITAGEGSRITISFRPFPYSPLRVPWQALISDFVWNERFCDVQERGPFATWTHCHSFESETRANDAGVLTSGTVIRDELEYELPMGALGVLAQKMLVGRQVRATFAFRRARVRLILPQLLGRGN